MPPPVLLIHIVIILSFSGSVHFFGSFDAPFIIPKSAPNVAHVQSVSSPQLFAKIRLFPKSPSPYKRPSTTNATFSGASKPAAPNSIPSLFSVGISLIAIP